MCVFELVLSQERWKGEGEFENAGHKQLSALLLSLPGFIESTGDEFHARINNPALKYSSVLLNIKKLRHLFIS